MKIEDIQSTKVREYLQSKVIGFEGIGYSFLTKKACVIWSMLGNIAWYKDDIYINGKMKIQFVE